MLHLSLLLSCAASGVLDVGPNQPYTEIQSAIDAAQSGDVIRIDDGVYSSISVQSKSLQIVARDDNGSVRISGAISVQGISVGQTLLIDGIEVVAEDASVEPAVLVSDSEGAIRIQDCTILGSTGFLAGSTQDRVALRGINVDDLTVHRSLLRGGLDTVPFDIGQDGVDLLNSAATFWDCTIEGTDCWWAAFGARGGDGIFARLSDLYVHGCTIRSGNGGDSDAIGCGANGCAGACIVSNSTVLRLRDISYDPGHGGWDASPCPGTGCQTFEPGDRLLETGAGTTTSYPGAGVDFELGHAVRSSGDAFDITLDGPTGTVAIMVLGPGTGRLIPTYPGYVGDVHVVGPFGVPRRVFLGAAPASLNTTLPDFGSLAVTQWYLQPALIGNGEILTGPVRAVTILGSGW